MKKTKTCEQRIDERLKARREDIEKYINAEDLEEPEDEDLPSFYNYGLGFDYVEAGIFDNEKGFYRYQFSWGGPSSELQFYEDGTVLFVFKDWFDVAKREVTGEDWILWLLDWFDGCGMMDKFRS